MYVTEKVVTGTNSIHLRHSSVLWLTRILVVEIGAHVLSDSVSGTSDCIGLTMRLVQRVTDAVSIRVSMRENDLLKGINQLANKWR